MSSMVRRMEIRGLKARGLYRSKFRFAKNAKGEEVKLRVPRGGMIFDGKGERVGYHWPRASSV